MPAIAIDHVSKRFMLAGYRPRGLKGWLVERLRGEEARPDEGVLWALKDVSFAIERGETFGIIGHNGSGKSTLLKLITGITRPSGGTVTVDGRVSPLIELGAGFHPEFSGRENVYLNGAILGLKRRELDRLFDSIVAFSELERFIEAPVKTYSSGMYMRLAFAIAIHVDPDLLVIDEVLAVGDAAFQQKCLDALIRFKHAGKTIVLVSHALSTVRELCQRVAWLDHGELRALGSADEVLGFYQEQVAQTIGAQREVLVPDARAGVSGLSAEGPLAMGAPARFSFEVLSELGPRELTARLVRADGVCCYDLCREVLPGRYSLGIPDLPLYPGHYALHVGLTGHEEKFYNFAVAGEAAGLGVAPLEARLELRP